MTGAGAPWRREPFGRGTFETAPDWPCPHGFTGKGADLAAGPLPASFDREADTEATVEALAERWGLETDRFVRLQQVHSATVVVLEDLMEDLVWGFGDLAREAARTEADALVTATAGWALHVVTADCAPILLHDPVRDVVAAVHAGWRGTAGGIGPRTLEVMERRFGCRPGDVRALVGPTAGGGRYEVDAPVVEPLRAASPRTDACLAPSPNPGRWMLDLARLNALILKDAGLSDVRVHGACTIEAADRWFSYRVEGARTGRNLGVIAL